MNWWQRLRHGTELERELDAELRFHFESAVAEHKRRGRSEEDARRLTRLEFGSLDQVKDGCRDARGTRWVDDLAQDARFGIRLLGNDRRFTATAVLTLALGIGVANVFFTIVNALCLRGLPITQPARVLYVTTLDAREQERGLSYPEFLAISEGTEVFAGTAAFVTAPMNLGDDGRAAERLSGTYATADTFHVLEEAPMLGRDFVPNDDRVGAPPVVILGNAVWRKRYGGDPSVVGQTVRINGAPATVVGIMRDGFRFPINSDIWQPLRVMPGLSERPRDTRTLGTMGRLKESVTIDRAQAELAEVARQLAHDYPDSDGRVRLSAVRINDHYNQKITSAVWLSFLTAAGLVFLVACANVANLLLTRSAGRLQEIGIRTSLGASRGRIVRQLMVESTLLAVVSAILGVGLSVAGLRLLTAGMPENAMPYWATFTMDRRVLLVLIGSGVASIFIFGLLPALHVARTDVSDVLKAGGRPGGGLIRTRRWTAVFLAGEFGLTFVLLAALAEGQRSARVNHRADVVMDTTHLLTMWVSLPTTSYGNPQARLAFYQDLEHRIGAISAVTSASISSALPLSGATPMQLGIDGRPAIVGQAPPTVWAVTIGPGYFETLGLGMRGGRDFMESDGETGHEAVIVNQRFVDIHFLNEVPVGRRIRLGAPGAAAPSSWATVVGIAPTIRQRPGGQTDPVVYLPYRASPPTTAALILRGSADSGSMAGQVREQMRALDADLPVYRVMTMEQALAEAGWVGRVSEVLATMMACLAWALSAVGLYAVTVYAVIRRTPEIGMRVALGAKPRHISWLVLRQAVQQVVMGVLVGIGCTFVWVRLLTDPAAPPGSPRMTDPGTLP